MLYKINVFKNLLELTRKHLKKKDSRQVFSCELCEISKNTFPIEHLLEIYLTQDIYETEL